MAKREDDVYNFGFILLESLIGPVPTTKGEAYLLNEMVTKRKKKKRASSVLFD